MNRWGLAAAGGVLVCCLVSPAGANEEKARAGIQENRQRLQGVRKELDRERAKAREATRQERSLSQELKQIDDQLSVKGRELRALEARLRSRGEHLATLNREMAAIEGRLQGSRRLLRQRLRAIYKQGRLLVVQVLATADDLAGLSRRVKYLSAVAEQDQRLIHQYAATLRELQGKRAAAERAKAELAEALGRTEAKRQEIVEEQRKRRILLARVREEKQGHLQTIKELEHAARDLQTLITRLQAEEASRTPRRAPRAPEAPPGEGVFAGLRGKLSWPAEGPVLSSFGRHEHPRYRTITYNRGIEIGAPLGEPIRAVADGVVLYADWFKGYGRLVILDHGGGYFTLYAHAAELLVRVGDRVTRGRGIARVGDTGSLNGAQLYFEVRFQGKPQDPTVWLVPRPAAAAADRP